MNQCAIYRFCPVDYFVYYYRIYPYLMMLIGKNALYVKRRVALADVEWEGKELEVVTNT